jgi:glucosamine 6-phosphate synthetase-like amidotransferase/phosphosugar isomerase protein
VADVISQPKRLEAFVKGLKVLGVPSVTMAAGPEVSSGEAFDLVLSPCENAGLRAIRGVVPFQILAHELAAARNVSIDTGKYPQLRPIFQTKSIHPTS